MIWIQRTSSFGVTPINDVAYNGSNLWVAVADKGKIATSLNGINWIQQTNPFGTNAVYGIAHDQSGLWVAVGNNGKLATSLNGEDWIERTSSFGTYGIVGIAHNGSNLWVAVGYQGKLATSSDGINWYQQTSSFGTGAIYHVAYNNSNLWVAVGSGGQLAISSDGENWEQVADSSFGTDAIYGIAYNNLNLWVAVGANGKLATSLNGEDWIQQISSFGTSTVYCVVHNGSNLWAIGGANGKIATSPTGIKWTQQTNPFGTETIWDFAHNGIDLWVVVGEEGILATSEEEEEEELPEGKKSKDIIEFVNRHMPSLLNVNEEIYHAMFGDINFVPLPEITKSADYQCGAIVNELEYLRAYINFMTSMNVEIAEGKLLEIIIYFFTRIRRIWDETDDDLRNRFYSIIRREANKRWDTIWSIRDVFSYYFNKDDIYMIENYIETNLITNGGFEQGSGNNFTDWSKSESGSSVIVEAVGGDEFVGDRAAEFQIDSSNSAASLYRTKNGVDQGHYKLDLFYWDDGFCPADNVITIEITRSSDGYYWDFAGNWQSGATGKDLKKKGIIGYTYWGEYIYQEEVVAEDITLTIKNKGASGTAYKFRIDEVNFGEWKNYPSFKVLVLTDFSSEIGDYVVLWNGSEDDNLMDRGECESTTSPMIFDETVPYEPTPANQTWSRDNTDPYMEDFNWRLNKDTAAAAGDAETFLADNKNTTDMHGLVAETKYTLAFRGKPDEITNVHKVIIHEYYSAAWHEIAILTDTAGSWKRYSETITLNAATTGFAISVFIDTDAAQNAKLDIDNMRLFKGEDADIEQAGYFDNDFIFGSGGGYSSSLYDDILDLIKPRGVKAVLEIVSA